MRLCELHVSILLVGGTMSTIKPVRECSIISPGLGVLAMFPTSREEWLERMCCNFLELAISSAATACESTKKFIPWSKLMLSIAIIAFKNCPTNAYIKRGAELYKHYTFFSPTMHSLHSLCPSVAISLSAFLSFWVPIVLSTIPDSHVRPIMARNYKWSEFRWFVPQSGEVEHSSLRELCTAIEMHCNQ